MEAKFLYAIEVNLVLLIVKTRTGTKENSKMYTKGSDIELKWYTRKYLFNTQETNNGWIQEWKKT